MGHPDWCWECPGNYFEKCRISILRQFFWTFRAQSQVLIRIRIRHFCRHLLEVLNHTRIRHFSSTRSDTLTVRSFQLPSFSERNYFTVRGRETCWSGTSEHRFVQAGAGATHSLAMPRSAKKKDQAPWHLPIACWEVLLFGEARVSRHRQRRSNATVADDSGCSGLGIL